MRRGAGQDFLDLGRQLLEPERLGQEMDITRARCRAVCRQFKTRYAEPYVFHAYFYRYFVTYWRQILTLRRLAEYEAKHGRGYHSPYLKFQKSIERRILRILLGFKI